MVVTLHYNNISLNSHGNIKHTCTHTSTHTHMPSGCPEATFTDVSLSLSLTVAVMFCPFSCLTVLCVMGFRYTVYTYFQVVKTLCLVSYSVSLPRRSVNLNILLFFVSFFLLPCIWLLLPHHTGPEAKNIQRGNNI